MAWNRKCPLVWGRLWNKNVAISHLFLGIWLLNQGIEVRKTLRSPL